MARLGRGRGGFVGLSRLSLGTADASARPSKPEDVSENGISYNSLFRNALCGCDRGIPFQKRLLVGLRDNPFSVTAYVRAFVLAAPSRFGTDRSSHRSPSIGRDETAKVNRPRRAGQPARTRGLVMGWYHLARRNPRGRRRRIARCRPKTGWLDEHREAGVGRGRGACRPGSRHGRHARGIPRRGRLDGAGAGWRRRVGARGVARLRAWLHGGWAHGG